MIPKRYRRNLVRLMYLLCVDEETALAMMKMTALMMDLDMDDDQVVDAILMDCGPDLEVRA